MSLEKIVKLACKPKAAPPKAKYLDPIIAATYSEDGAIPDVSRALAMRMREPNAIVVFKALIVLHTMIRNGSTDNVLSHLASSDALRLQNVSQGNWDGYRAPENLANYARYLESRIKGYRDLKHDVIRVQTESNRDHRLSVLGDDQPPPPSRGVQRSKTIIGRKLRVMSVEKGLLRETKIVQSMVDSLSETKFYLDDLEDELNVTALRMLVKDLLVLFQAQNEGVINVLEHYFEMSHVDATSALSIYKKFCRQTEKVVEYLSVAKKLQTLLNVSIPNLRHAPVSLVNALEEYLADPNFEQNRLEYKANKDAADGRRPARTSGSTPPDPSLSAASTSSAAATEMAQPASSKPSDQRVLDFFSSIEQEQPTMFNPNTNSPTSNYFQQQATFNPFIQRQSMALPQMTGAVAFGQSQQPFLQAQPTGFPAQPSNGPFAPQMTGLPQQSPFTQPSTNAFLQPQSTNAFLQPQPTNAFLQPQPANAFSQPQQQPFLRPQSTAFLQPQSTGFLQPQATGANPFRQSMLMPQGTGLSAFGNGNFGSANGGSNPFPRAASPTGMSSASNPPLGLSGAFSNASAFTQPSAFNDQSTQPNASPFPPAGGAQAPAGISRPASTPIVSHKTGDAASPIARHQTGSRNPFGQPAPPPVPPLPKGPTLQQLTTGAFGQNSTLNANPFPSTSSPFNSGASSNPANTSSTNGGGLFSSIASSFVSGTTANSGQTNNASSSPFSANGLALNPTGSTSTWSPSVSSGPTSASTSSTLSAQPTSTPTWSNAFSTSSNSTNTTAPSNPPSITPLQSQPTGFGGSAIKPFKPSSSFGASLLDSLPPIPGSGPSTPQTTSPPPINSNSGTNINSLSSAFNTTGALNAQPTGYNLGGAFGGASSLSSGLRPQATGMAGAANPFRASSVGGPMPSFGLSAPGGLNSISEFGTFQTQSSPGQGQQQHQQQQQQQSSLI